MSPSDQHLACLSATQDARLEQIVRAFDQLCRRGEKIDLADFLPEDEPLRTAVLVELVLTAVQYRTQAGQWYSLESWTRQFPDLAADSVVHRLRAAWPAPLATHGSPPPEPDLVNALPRRLGRFELLEALGRGSCGIVYKAQDTELGRTVAVKVPHAGAGMKVDAARFQREARAAARLRHANIVALHEVGEEQGVDFLVSDFVAGSTLADRLRQGPVSPREAVDWLAQVADAVDYAHRQGVVHRDLKPANILLDAWAKPHVTDFGLARTSADATLTSEGDVLGTPAYISPEQARGDACQADARSDVYSLGAILYQMLTGEVPFRGNSRMVLLQVLEDEPQPPRRLVETVPRELEAVCLKAMAKCPSERYATAAALAVDLRRWLAGEPVGARPVGPLGRLLRWRRRRPIVAALAASLLLSVATGLTVAIWLWRLEETERRRAEHQFRAAYTAVRNFHDLLFEGDRFEDPTFQPIRLAALQEAVQLYDGFLKEAPDNLELRVAAADANYHLGFLQRGQGAPDKALDALERSRTLREALTKEEPESAKHRHYLAKALAHIGEIQLQDGRLDEALRSQRRAFELREQLAREHPGTQQFLCELAYSHQCLAGLYHLRKVHDLALHAARQACAIRERLRQDFPENTENCRQLGLTYRLIATLHRRARSLDDAAIYYGKAEALQQRLLGDGPSTAMARYDLAGTLIGIGALRIRQKNHTDALQHFLQARQLLQALCQEYPGTIGYWPTLAESHYLIAGVRQAQKEWAAATSDCTAAESIYQKLIDKAPKLKTLQNRLSNTRARLADIHFQLGSDRSRSGQWQDAIDSFGRAIRLREQLILEAPSRPISDSNLLVKLYHQRGQALENLERYDAAFTDFEQALRHHGRVGHNLDPNQQQREAILQSQAQARAKMSNPSAPNR